MRRVRDKLVVRLEKELHEKQIRELSHSFADIILDGEIQATEALPAEGDQPELLDKPRIAFSYNDQSASRLTQMIHTINQLGQLA